MLQTFAEMQIFNEIFSVKKKNNIHFQAALVFAVRYNTFLIIKFEDSKIRNKGI